MKEAVTMPKSSGTNKKAKSKYKSGVENLETVSIRIDHLIERFAV